MNEPGKLDWKDLSIKALAVLINLGMAFPGTLVCIYAFLVTTTGTIGWNNREFHPTLRLIIFGFGIPIPFLFFYVFYQVYKGNYKLMFLSLAANGLAIGLCLAFLGAG